MPASSMKSFWVLAASTLLVTACGGGGGGGSGGTSTPPTGSLAIAEVDTDHNGLIEISTLEQLDWIRNNPQGTALVDFQGQSNANGCPSSGCSGYELVADLDFDTNGDGVVDSKDTYYDYDKDGTNAGWLPISRFSGTFNGNNHHIRNLFINRPNTQQVGLFGSTYLGGSTKKSVTFENLYLDGKLSVSGDTAVGALVGEINASADAVVTITNIRLSGSIFAKFGNAGGIAGDIFFDDSTIPNTAKLNVESNTAASSVTVSSDGLSGGMIGSISSVLNASYLGSISIRNNSASANVTASTAGGLIGGLGAASLTTLISDNSSSGVVQGTTYSAGGLIGSIGGDHVSLRSCSSESTVTAHGDNSYAGGAVGWISTTMAIDRLSATGDVRGAGSVGGAIGFLNCKEGASLSESYATGAVGYFLEAASNTATGDTSSGARGGLIGGISVNGSCAIRGNYSTSVITPGSDGGGIIGDISFYAGNIEISSNFFAGSLNATLSAAGILHAAYGSAISVKSNLILGQVITATNYVGAIAGYLPSDSPSIEISDNYWATDTTTAPLAITADITGVTLTNTFGEIEALLECPTSANSFSCVSGELFHDWDSSVNTEGQPTWSFGTTAQLPGLRIGNQIHRPVYDSGGYSISVENL